MKKEKKKIKRITNYEFIKMIKSGEALVADNYIYYKKKLYKLCGYERTKNNNTK